MHKFKKILLIFNEQSCIYVHIYCKPIYNDNKHRQVNKDRMKRKTSHKNQKNTLLGSTNIFSMGYFNLFYIIILYTNIFFTCKHTELQWTT